MPPAAGFLEGLQALCRQNGALFILDEVMTGFRVALGGAQALWELDPDLTCLGKVIGGGLPVGAYAGKRAIMQQVAPAGPMYQAGTLSGNPLAMTAGLATLRTLTEAGRVRASSCARRQNWCWESRRPRPNVDVPVQAGCEGTMFGFYFLKSPGTVITTTPAQSNMPTRPTLREFLPRHAGARRLLSPPASSRPVS